MMKLIAKIHKVGQEKIVAVCDKNLLNKTIKFGEVKVVVDEEFYGNQEVDVEFLKKELTDATIGNFIGKGAVKLALKTGLINEENIIYVGKIPHAQFVVV